MKPAVASAARHDDPVEALDVPEALERVDRRAAALDARVDGDARLERGVLDRLEQRHRRCDLLAHRRVERELAAA